MSYTLICALLLAGAVSACTGAAAVAGVALAAVTTDVLPVSDVAEGLTTALGSAGGVALIGALALRVTVVGAGGVAARHLP